MHSISWICEHYTKMQYLALYENKSKIYIIGTQISVSNVILSHLIHINGVSFLLAC